MTISCEALSDKMPLVAHQHAVWTESEAAHLASCADCAAEWRLVQRAAGLGAGAAADLVPARLGTDVLARVRAEHRRRRVRAGWMAVLAAACFALVLWRMDWWGGSRPARPAPVPLAEFHLPLAELEGLDQAQLQAVLDDWEGPLGGSSASEVPSMSDLNDHQLERVLRSLEG